MMPDDLRGLFALRDALQQQLGEAIVSMSRLGSASADAHDDEIAGIIESLAFRLKSVTKRIAAYGSDGRVRLTSPRNALQSGHRMALGA